MHFCLIIQPDVVTSTLNKKVTGKMRACTQIFYTVSVLHVDGRDLAIVYGSLSSSFSQHFQMRMMTKICL